MPIVLSVIAPCYNEEANVSTLVARMMAVFDDLAIPAELLLIDDGSADRTWECIEEQAALEPRVRGIKHTKNQGIEGGWRTGVAEGRGELVCLIDSDLQNRPEDIPRLYAAWLAESPDMVQAVRHPKGVKSRRLFSRALNHILNLSFGMSLRDNKSGFIICRRETLRELLEHRYHYKYFQSFIGCAAGVRNLRIVEVDTDFEARHGGESFLSHFPVAVSLRIVGELVKYRAETLPIDARRRR
ncbi:MAG: glycosyltransferase family 2 protein [Myxococcales bacterium]|nr:glycosyltransferase family 2 protein [Myxococcales bacterium]